MGWHVPVRAENLLSLDLETLSPKHRLLLMLHIGASLTPHGTYIPCTYSGLRYAIAGSVAGSGLDKI